VDAHHVLDAKVADTVVDLGPEWPVTDERQPNIAVAACDDGDRPQCEQRLLDRNEIADPDDEPGGRRECEGGSRLCSGHPRVVVGDAAHQDRAPPSIRAQLDGTIDDRTRGRDDVVRSPEHV
jgi:hypothetical protein